MSRLLSAVKTQPDTVVTLDYAPVEVHRLYSYWRFRILTTTIIGYALYYFVRVNISVPLESMGRELHYSKEQLGTITTIGGVTYGISKFINGILGDHANPRFFMAIGLIGCAVMNLFFGFSSALLFFGVFWFCNNYFQGMGFPPCAKSMAYWFSPRERASTFGIWHASHMIGAAFVGALTGYLDQYLGWRSCFFIPAGLATIGAIIVLVFLRDTPGSLGLPPVEVYKGEERPEELAAELKEPVVEPEEGVVYGTDEPAMSYWQIVWKYILLSPYMWLISFANLAVYVLRYAQITWGPTFLQETKGFSKVQAGWLFFGSEMGGLCGALAGGFLADKLFRGRAGRVCVIAMVCYAGAIEVFRFAPRSAPLLAGTAFVLMGFLLYVPQMLIAAMAMNLGTKRASAAAVGLTGIIGYASTIITGWGIGKLVDTRGWGAAFQMMLGCATITLVLMAFTWNVGAHPHAKDGH